MITPEDGRVSSWPEVAQYLLRNYAQSTHIDFEIIHLRAVRQSHYESENAFSKHIKDAMARSVNVRSGDEVLMIFLDGLEATIRTLIARHRESHLC